MFFLSDFNVIKPEPGLLIWTSIIFILFWLLLAKFAFRPIANALKKRENDIADALAEAENARAEMAAMKAQNEEILSQAREERSKILKEAKEVKEGIIAEAKGKAKEEAKKIVAEAKNEIESQKNAALKEVKNTVGTMALDIAEKVIKKELATDSKQQRFVEDLVKEINLS